MELRGASFDGDSPVTFFFHSFKTLLNFWHWRTEFYKQYTAQSTIFLEISLNIEITKYSTENGHSNVTRELPAKLAPCTFHWLMNIKTEKKKKIWKLIPLYWLIKNTWFSIQISNEMK